MAYTKPPALMDTEWGERVGGIPQTPWKLIAAGGALVAVALAAAIASAGGGTTSSTASPAPTATVAEQPAFAFTETETELTRPEMHAIKKGSSLAALVEQYGEPGGIGPNPYGEAGSECLAYSAIPGSGGWLFCFQNGKLVGKHTL